MSRVVTALALLLTTSAFAADGAVEGVVFGADGGPVPGVVVSVGGVSATTDDDGAFRLVHPTGAFPVALRPPGSGELRLADVVVVEGQTTELLVTLTPGAPLVTVEVPEEARVEAPELVDPGFVRGRVVHGEDGTPIAGARVFARGIPSDATSGADGSYDLPLPPGTWDVTVLESGFATRTVAGVVVVTGQVAELTLELLPAGLALDDFVITAPAIVGGTADLLEDRRDSASVTDVLGAEQMSKSGDSSAASALRRVTGLTVVGGRYVYVRGLGERYSSTLLNGASLPSPEPERRVVPLDLFPAGVLESVTIQKTFSPEMPAEFGGGTILLATRRAPAEPFLQVSASGSWNSNTSLRQGPAYQGGPTDWLGFGADARALPADVAKASDNSPLEESDMFSDTGYTAEELEAFGESMDQNWKVRQRNIPLDKGLSLSGGTRADFGRHTLGFLAGGTYGDEWDRGSYPAAFTFVSNGKVEVKHNYDFLELQRRVKLGGLATATWSYDDTQEITGLVFLSRLSDDETRTYEGYNADVGGDIRVTRLRWLEQQLLTVQVLGSHHLFGDQGLDADWRITSSVAGRLEPDRRETRFDYEENLDAWKLSDRPEGNQRFFSTLSDQTSDYGLDLKKPIRLAKEQDLRLGAGGAYVRKIRAVDSRRFKYMHKGERSRLDEVLTQVEDPGDIFAPENIGNDGFQFEEITLATDNYAASHKMASAYAVLDVDLTKSTRLLGGARLEDSVQRVLTFELFNPDAEPVLAEIATRDLLPAATVTQGLPADMQVRLGYGKTVSRPDFREMSPATFDDVTGGRQTFGNPNLDRATIDNLDLRWEWYPSAGESLSVAGFRKVFHQPIEQIVIASAQQSVTYANALRAENLGIELDWRKGFGFVTDALQDVYVAGNVAWITSQVEIGEQQNAVQSNDTRALQGQSPYALNLQLGYDHPEGRQTVAVMYNQFGRRITEAGSSGAPDTYEASYGTLDAVASTALPAGLRLGLSAKNLLDPMQEITQGRLVVLEDRDGFELGLTLTWKAGG